MTTIAPKTIRSTAAASSTAVLRLYLRQSISEDRNTAGIPAQRSICERYAQQHGLPWASRVEYVDVGYSRDDVNRPEYKRLLDETRGGDTVLLWDRSRLGVDLDYAVAVRDLIERRGAKIVVTSTGETIDLVGEMADVTEFLHGKSGGGEMRRIRRLTREKLRERVIKGYVASKLPYGLESYPEHPDDEDSWKLGRKAPAEEAVILRVVALYLDERWGWQKIARQLNRDGVPSPIGKPRTFTYREGKRAGQTVTTTGKWAPSHISDIMTNPTYRGVYIFGTGGGKGGKFAPITVEHPEWKIGTDEMWAAVDAAMTSRTTDMRSKLNSAKHPLAGVGKCECGGSLMVVTDGPKNARAKSYVCARRVRDRSCSVERYRAPKALLEEGVAAGYAPYFDAALVAIREFACEVTARIAGQAAPNIPALESELAAEKVLQARRAKLAAMADGSVDALVDELKTGQRRIREVEVEIAAAKRPGLDATAIGREIEAVAIQRLDALRAALGGPNAREALRAMFPQGIGLRAAPDAFHVEAIGVLTMNGNSSNFPTVVRTPFRVSIPRRAA